MAYIRKLKNNTFQAAVYVGLSTKLDKKGKPIKLYEYITCDLERDCRAKARELEKDIEDGTYSNLQNMLFSAYAPKWLKTHKNMIASTTYRDYKMYIKKHFSPFFDRFKLKDITEFNVKEYINEKLETLSPTTVKKHFHVLNLMLRDALKSKNPCKDIEPPRPNNYIPTVPTDEEFKLIHEAVKGTFDEPIILLAAWCGMREGEIFALKNNDIDIENSGLRVDENMAIHIEENAENGKDSYTYDDKEPKSRNGKRFIIVQSYLMNLLKDIMAEHEKNIAKQENKIIDIISQKDRKGNEPYKLFKMRPESYSERFSNIINYHNELFDAKKKYGIEGLKNSLKFQNSKSLKKNIHIQNKKIPDIRFHDLRHFHTTVLYENDIPDQYVAERLGDNIKTMKQVYQHLRLEKKKAIDEKIKEIFK
jgi:integrase